MLYIKRNELENICSAILEAHGLPSNEARDSAEMLVAADARGIHSHGVARIKRYTDGLKAGLMKGSITPKIMHETPISLTLDAQGAMGLPLSKQVMNKVIDKAKNQGIGVCSVRNSNHFGIAGYYSEMAARQDMIGIAMTNTPALGVPTFSREAAFGTNAIAFAAPALNGKLFSLDMSTTAVSRGKVEVYKREGKQLPRGWAVGTDGHITTDPVSLLDNMLNQRGGGLVPLGGEGDLKLGYKGYGLGVIVDILCAVASGGEYGRAVKDINVTGARVCHFFMALKLDIFRPADEFKKDMNAMLEALNSLAPAEGASRVYYAGQIEQEAEEESNIRGVPVDEDVWKMLNSLTDDIKN